MDIPQAVLDKAKVLIDTFGENFENLGVHQGKQVYSFLFPKGSATGFPFVFLYDKQTETVDTITGYEALDFLFKL